MKQESSPQVSTANSKTRQAVSLAMILGKPDKKIKRLLDNIEGVFDEIVIAAGNAKEVKEYLKDYPVKVYQQPKECFVSLDDSDYEFFKEFGLNTKIEQIFRFDIARNFSFSKATGDWIMWLDDDDIIDSPHLIREIIDNAPLGAGAIDVNYAYLLDSQGRSLVDHWRTRIIRNNSGYRWKGVIHEDILGFTPRARTFDFQVLHLQEMDNRDAKTERNLVSILKQYKDTQDDPDPRILYYLGQALFDIGSDELGREILKGFIKISGWNEQRYDAWMWIARKGEPMAAFEAIREIPEYPMAYFFLGEHYLNQDKPEKALEWYQTGFSKPKPQTMLAYNPRSLDVHPLLGMAEVYIDLAKPKKAIECLQKVLEFYPDDQETLDKIKTYEKVYEFIEAGKAYGKIARYLYKEGYYNRLTDLLKSVPMDLEDDPIIITIRNKFFKRDWKDNEITIYCPVSYEEWDPTKLSEGIGGSEEAVIRLSNELRDLGWKVTVYGNPKKHGQYDGVTYLRHETINPNDNFNVFIGFRDPALFDKEWKAKKTYLWMHDVEKDEAFTPERLANITKVILLTKYHRSLFPSIPEDKVLYSSNGITLEELPEVKRNPHKMVYTSCPSRGLEHLLSWWPEIRKEVPDAELHVFYGFHNFVKRWKDDPDKMRWVAMMEKMLTQEGITFHGRKGQDEIVKHTLESGVWPYPTQFPEIFCITAIKCEAYGAYPVTSGYAALAETQSYGYKATDGEKPTYKDLNKVKEEIIKALKNPISEDERTKMMESAKKWDWKKVAESWAEEMK
jgi:tetratricopeptide (TPR) repeat protein